jgi:MFS family permease
MHGVSRLSTGQRIAYLGGSFTVGIFGAFNNFTMSLWLTGFTTSYLLISLLGNSKSVEGSIVSPLAGILSDRTWMGWLGRRRPFMLFGGLASAILLASTPYVARLALPPGLWGLSDEIIRLLPVVGVIFLFTLTFNIGDDLHKALRADLTEGKELNFLSSLATIADIGAQVALLVIGFLLWKDGIPDWAFIFAGSLVALGTLVTVLGIREPSPEEWSARNTVAPSADAEHISPIQWLREYRGAVMFLVVTFAYWSGVNAVLPLISLFVRDILHTSEGEAQLLPALLLLSTTVMAIPIAKLGSRFGKRRMLAMGYAAMAAAAVAGLLITTKEQGIVLFLLAGIGNSAPVVLAIPVMADLVRKQHMGAATGLMAAASSIASPLASLVAGSLSDFYGPRAIFAVMAVMTVFAVILLIWVDKPAAAARVETAVPEPEPVPLPGLPTTTV